MWNGCLLSSHWLYLNAASAYVAYVAFVTDADLSQSCRRFMFPPASQHISIDLIVSRCSVRCASLRNGAPHSVAVRRIRAYSSDQYRRFWHLRGHGSPRRCFACAWGSFSQLSRSYSQLIGVRRLLQLEFSSISVYSEPKCREDKSVFPPWSCEVPTQNSFPRSFSQLGCPPKLDLDALNFNSRRPDLVQYFPQIDRAMNFPHNTNLRLKNLF